MASKPFFIASRNTWVIKYRPDPAGPWKTETLCKHHEPWTKGRPPKKPPQVAIDRAKEFAELEYRAKHGMGKGPSRAKGLAGYLDSYLETYRTSHDGHSTKQMARHIRRFTEFADGAGVGTLQEVNRALCRNYLESRYKAGASHETLRTERGYLIGIWSRAIADELLTANPWTDVKPPGKPKPGTWTFWTPDEIKQIADRCARPWQQDAVLVMGHTGLRISTALAMAWTWIKWTDGVILIPRGEGIKTQYTHCLGEVARSTLERIQMASESDLVFPNPIDGRSSNPSDTLREAIGRAIELAGVKPGTPHDLRHSYARNLVRSGVPITVVQKQLGHTTLGMTMRYCSADEENVREAIERAERVTSATSPPQPTP